MFETSGLLLLLWHHGAFGSSAADAILILEICGQQHKIHNMIQHCIQII